MRGELTVGQMGPFIQSASRVHQPPLGRSDELPGRRATRVGREGSPDPTDTASNRAVASGDQLRARLPAADSHVHR